MPAQRKGTGTVVFRVYLKEKPYDKMIQICERKNLTTGKVLNDITNEAIEKFNKENGGVPK